MGITSSIFPAESCEGQVPGCDRHAPEVSDPTVQDVAFYTQTLGVSVGYFKSCFAVARVGLCL